MIRISTLAFQIWLDVRQVESVVALLPDFDFVVDTLEHEGAAATLCRLASKSQKGFGISIVQVWRKCPMDRVGLDFHIDVGT